MKKGIPTTYRGIRFRSRIEARWAAMFDQLKWGWDYEPLDLKGYIPDFVLAMSKPTKSGIRRPLPVLVEVKHELTLEALDSATEKVDQSGWRGEALILGARPVYREEPVPASEVSLGLFKGTDAEPWSAGRWVTCCECNKATFIQTWGSWHCRACGLYDKGRNLYFDCDQDELEKVIRLLWAEASNLTAWKAIAA